MKRLILVLVFLTGTSGVTHSQHHHPSPAGVKPVILLSGLGEHHHPVSTNSVEAQKFFDQGLTLVYGFNHDEAARSFKRAAELDPDMAMAYWGLALARGPYYNVPTIPPEQHKECYEAVQKGLGLAAKAPEHERAYLEAMAKRFSDDPKADQEKLAVAYKDAMAALAKRYPDDLEAATLYADSAMTINAWGLWGRDGKPSEGTEEIVAALESILNRDPNHIGANHLYIHAIEMSPRPERALPSADRLGRLSPGAGHLVHMPSHIYMRVGDYEAAARSNDMAAKADRAYIEATGAEGVYPSRYFSHNLHFLAAAYSMQGRFEDARRAAEQLQGNVTERITEPRRADRAMSTMTLVSVRFRRWDDILRSPAPASSMPVSNILWHWARGLAYAAKGKINEAEAELKTFEAGLQALPAEARYGANKAHDAMRIAEHSLRGKIEFARGDRKAAIEHLKKAVEAEDALAYDEPPDWYHAPSRESLGGALMSNGEFAEAEKVFRADLERNRRNGRSLFGLMESLKAQGKKYDAQIVQKEYEKAWKSANIQLKLEDL